MMETNPATTSLAVIAIARAGRFAEVREMFAPQLRPRVAELGRSGPVASIGTPMCEPVQSGVVVVKVPVEYERGEQTVVVSVTEAGQLTGIQLAPSCERGRAHEAMGTARLRRPRHFRRAGPHGGLRSPRGAWHVEPAPPE